MVSERLRRYATSSATHSEAEDDRLAERGALSPAELSVLAERTAQEFLGVSAAEAFEMLDRGELNGTLAENALLGLRFLLTS